MTLSMMPAEEEVQWAGGKMRIGGQSLFLPMYVYDVMKVKKQV